jgi:hypothetical protein
MSFCDLLLVEAPADQPLDREQRILLELVTAWRLADWPTSTSPSFGEGDDRRRGAIALAVLDHLGLVALHDGDTGIGRTEVNSDDLAHD